MLTILFSDVLPKIVLFVQNFAKHDNYHSLVTKQALYLVYNLKQNKMTTKIELGIRYFDNLDQDYFTVVKFDEENKFAFLLYEGECLYKMEQDGTAKFEIEYMNEEIANGTVILANNKE